MAYFMFEKKVKNLIFPKKGEKFKIKRKQPHFPNPRTQKLKVRWTNLNLSNYFSSYRIDVNPNG